jgi:hypothetical protein
MMDQPDEAMMDDDFLDDVPAPGATSSRHALLTAALLHLMSQYTLSGARPGRPDAGGGERDGPCVKLACVIQRHLDALARLPEAEPVLRATCEQLSVRWDDLVACRLPPVSRLKAREPFLVRLLGPRVTA